MDDNLDTVEDTVDIAVGVEEEVDILDIIAEYIVGKEEVAGVDIADMDLEDIGGTGCEHLLDNVGREIVKIEDLV